MKRRLPFLFNPQTATTRISSTESPLPLRHLLLLVGVVLLVQFSKPLPLGSILELGPLRCGMLTELETGLS